MNIQILHLSDIHPFTYQKCLIPRELFPKDVIPGALAKCRDSTNNEYVCNIYPMSNQHKSNFCWLDDTVKVGREVSKNTTTRNLTTIEVLNTSVLPASRVILLIKITEKLLDMNQSPSKQLLSLIARDLLQPYTFVSKSFITSEELQSLGIAGIHIEEADLNVFSIDENTEVVISNVKLQTTNQKYVLQKLDAMKVPRDELQQLVRNSAVYKNSRCKLKPPLNALIIGPPGSGKTSLCGNFILENNCNTYTIRTTEILGQYPGETEAAIRRIFNSMKNFVHCFEPSDPTVILIEEIDLICPGNKNVASDAAGNMSRISGQLISLLDDLTYESSKLIVLATTSNLDAINSCLRRPGRFGIEINIPALQEEQRGEIFKSMIGGTFYGKGIDLSEEMVHLICKQTQGFVASDLALLVHSIGQDILRNGYAVELFSTILEHNLKSIKPTSFHNSDVTVYKTDEKFDSIGGMERLKRILEVSILAGLREKAAFERFALCLPKGVLLYGPPGCAKTTIAKCLATEAKMTFIPTSAAEVYSPYVGNSEKYISKIFDTARRNSPCIVFLDEIDSLVGKRVADASSNIQTRILSTLLTEMDGIGVKLYTGSPGGNDILVVAATNRPEMIDDALLRPGRFDKLIHVPAPDFESRLQILKIRAAEMPFSSEVDMGAVAEATENFSGADVCNLCNEAAMHAFTENFDADHIATKDFKSVLRYQKSSLTQSQIKWYSDYETKHSK